MSMHLEPVGSLKLPKDEKNADNPTWLDRNMMEAGKENYSDPTFLFSNFVFSFCRFFVSSFLFFSFVFSSLFIWFSHVLSILSERSTTVLEGLEKEAPKSTQKKEAPMVTNKVEPVKAIQWKEEVKATDKKEVAKEGDKKEAPKPTDKKETPKAIEKKEETVVMKVPICCGQCADRVRIPLERIQGVKSVECDFGRNKVTVVVTTATPADVLSECVKIFKQSRMWRGDD